MKKIIIILCVLIVEYQGYSQIETKKTGFYAHIPYLEKQIISILKKGEIVFSKNDMFLERNDTSFYVKNIEFLLQDSIFKSAYLESTVFYGEGKKDQKNMHWDCLIINDRWGNQMEVIADNLIYLPKLSKYLDRKLKKTPLKECDEKYLLLE